MPSRWDSLRPTTPNKTDPCESRGLSPVSNQRGGDHAAGDGAAC